MNLVIVFISIFIISNELKSTSATLLTRSPNKSAFRFWTDKKFSRHETSTSDRSPRTTGKNETSLVSVETSDRQINRIPQVNFYQSIPNALGVIGQGIIWLREISAALGTPLPIWIFTIPFFILGVGLMFMPDLTQLELPLFYPNGGGDSDPFAAFPPLPDLEDISSLNIMKQISQQLIPPKFLLERFGR